jgi:hypothetical protein
MPLTTIELNNVKLLDATALHPDGCGAAGENLFFL